LAHQSGGSFLAPSLAAAAALFIAAGLAMFSRADDVEA
jgi:hypothetical protein